MPGVPPGGPPGVPPGVPPGGPPVVQTAPGVVPPFPPPNFNQPPPNFSQPPPGFGPPPTQRFDYAHGQTAAPVPPDHAGPPVVPPPGPIQLPDFSKPPPGFPVLPPPLSVPPPAHTEADLTPTVPYFELPAGLMAPLVKVNSFLLELAVPLEYVVLPRKCIVL